MIQLKFTGLPISKFNDSLKLTKADKKIKCNFIEMGKDEKKPANNILTQRQCLPAYSESLPLRGGKGEIKLDSLKLMWAGLPKALQRTGRSQRPDETLGVNSKSREGGLRRTGLSLPKRGIYDNCSQFFSI